MLNADLRIVLAMIGKVKKALVFIFAFLTFMVIIPILCVLLGFFIDGLLGFANLMIGHPALRISISIILLAVGAYLTIASNLYLYRFGDGFAWGDVFEEHETKTLVTDGPFKYTRNPMLLGYALIISAVGLLVNSLSTALIIPLLLIIGEGIWIKRIEEPRLERRFGREYLEYKREVPFLIPRIPRRVMYHKEKGMSEKSP